VLAASLASVLLLVLPGCTGSQAAKAPKAPAEPVTPRPADACQLLPAATARALLGEVVSEPARAVEHLSGVPAFDTCSYAAVDRKRGTARVGVAMLPGSAATLAARRKLIASQPWETGVTRNVNGIGDAAFVTARAGVALVGDREVFVRLGGFTGAAPPAAAVESLLRAAASRLPSDSPVGVLQSAHPCELVAAEFVDAVLGGSARVTRTIVTGTKEEGSAITCLWGTGGRTAVAEVTRDPAVTGRGRLPGGARAYVEEVGKLGLARRVVGIGLLGYRVGTPEVWTVLVDDSTALELVVIGGPKPTEESVEALLQDVVAAVA
jgi:hypothetical protein